MKYNGIIEKKLRMIEQKLSEIDSWKIKSLDQLQNSSMLSNATERALQVAIEIMIDVSERILALEKIPPQEEAAKNMKKLEELKIIKSADIYMDMVRFRNFIVHRYEYIDLDIILNIVKDRLKYFKKFVSEIRSHK